MSDGFRSLNHNKELLIHRLARILVSVNMKHGALNKPLQISNPTFESKHEQVGVGTPSLPPKKNFRAAICLIISTAVSPDMLDLPSARIKAGGKPIGMKNLGIGEEEEGRRRLGKKGIFVKNFGQKFN